MFNEGYKEDFVEEREIIKITTIESGSDAPYIKEELIVKEVVIKYNPEYGDDRICECGDPYYRHFDSYEGMAPVGCKYCNCYEFIEQK